MEDLTSTIQDKLRNLVYDLEEEERDYDNINSSINDMRIVLNAIEVKNKVEAILTKEFSGKTPDDEKAYVAFWNAHMKRKEELRLQFQEEQKITAQTY